MSNEKKPDFSNVQSGSSTTATKIYVVVSGDSLSKIAQREYGNGNDWKRIYEDYAHFLAEQNVWFRFTEGTFDRFMQAQKL